TLGAGLLKRLRADLIPTATLGAYFGIVNWAVYSAKWLLPIFASAIFLFAAGKKYKEAWAHIEGQREFYERAGGIVRDGETHITFEYPERGFSVKKPRLRDEQLQMQGVLYLTGFILVVVIVSIIGGKLGFTKSLGTFLAISLWVLANCFAIDLG